MKEMNDGKQMKDVWTGSLTKPSEKVEGKHPTQKPLALLVRIILASTQHGAWILDPFSGSGTTGIAASLTGRRYLGIEREKEYLDLSIRRRVELENGSIVKSYRKKIRDIVIADGEPEEADIFGVTDENRIQDLPF